MDFFSKYNIRIRRIEERKNDHWIDMSLKTLRKGEVRFYNVDDQLTGKWLFKVCYDNEMGRTIVKSLKCPAGKSYAQLEGRTMLFQRSLFDGYCYDIISLSYTDKEFRLRRNIIGNIEEVPPSIRENFKIVDYNEATGKKGIGKRLVTLSEERDEKKMIILFLLQRGWPISRISPEIGVKISKLLKVIRDLEKASIEDIYNRTEKEFEISRDKTQILLDFLELKGKIKKTEGFIKTSN